MTLWKARTEARRGTEVETLDLDELVDLARSYDGRQREAAVRELVRRGDPRAVAVLLVCTGDWVMAVRRAARQGLLAFMRDTDVAQWARALPELGFVYRVRRADLRELRLAIEDFLARHLDTVEALAPVLDDAMRRWLFALRLERAQDPAVRLALLCGGARGNDLVTAQFCMAAADRLPSSEEKQALFEAAARSRLPRVRVGALRALLGLPGHDARALARTMCFDTSAAVRALALGALPDESEALAARAAEVLEARASEARARAAALHVLHLLGDSRALAFARVLADAPVAALRRSARALMLSAARGDELDRQLLALLADPSPKLRRLAAEHVRRGAPVPNAEALMRLGLERPERAPDVMAMLACGSPWDRLLFVLSLLARRAPSDRLRDAVRIEIDAWVKAMAGSYVRPRSDQAERLRSLWGQRAELQPFGWPADVEYHLGAFDVI